MGELREENRTQYESLKYALEKLPGQTHMIRLYRGTDEKPLVGLSTSTVAAAMAPRLWEQAVTDANVQRKTTHYTARAATTRGTEETLVRFHVRIAVPATES